MNRNRKDKRMAEKFKKEEKKKKGEQVAGKQRNMRSYKLQPPL